MVINTGVEKKPAHTFCKPHSPPPLEYSCYDDGMVTLIQIFGGTPGRVAYLHFCATQQNHIADLCQYLRVPPCAATSCTTRFRHPPMRRSISSLSAVLVAQLRLIALRSCAIVVGLCRLTSSWSKAHMFSMGLRSAE